MNVPACLQRPGHPKCRDEAKISTRGDSVISGRRVRDVPPSLTVQFRPPVRWTSSSSLPSKMGGRQGEKRC